MLLVAVSYGYRFVTSVHTQLSLGDVTNGHLINLICESQGLEPDDFDEVVVVHNDKVVHTFSVHEEGVTAKCANT